MRQKTLGDYDDQSGFATTGYVAVILIVTAVFAVADLLWLPFSRIVVVSENFVELAEIALFLTLMYGIGVGVSWRLLTDDSRLAGRITHAAQGLLILVRSAALFIPFGFLGGIFMYLASATQLPLMDAELAQIDAIFGFDWLAFLTKLNALPEVSAILVFAYHSVGPQIPVVFLILAFTYNQAHLFEFVALVAVSSLFTAIGMTLVPAAGAYAYYAPQPEEFSSFTREAGMWHYAELLKLRSGEAYSYLASNAEGLVTFPSFHTALGVMITYALRDLKWVFPFVLALNVTMIVSTIPEGGHHLVDIVAGLAIALLSIVLVRSAGKLAWNRRLVRAA